MSRRKYTLFCSACRVAFRTTRKKDKWCKKCQKGGDAKTVRK